MVERHVANFVEKKRAAVGLLEFSDVPRSRARERAFFVAEKLRLHQLGGNRGAIQRNERPAVPRAFFVQRARDQLLARSRFAPNADARLARRHVLDLRHHLAHRRACPHDLMPAQPALQIAILFFQARQAQRVLDREQQLFGRDRLFEKIDGAQPRGAHGHFDGGLPGHHHRRRRHADIFEIFEQRDAVPAGHHHVGENQVEALGLCQFERARRVVADGRFVARQPKRARERRERVRVVVDDQDVGFQRHGAMLPHSQALRSFGSGCVSFGRLSCGPVHSASCGCARSRTRAAA